MSLNYGDPLNGENINMKLQEYKDLEQKILIEGDEDVFRWELLKALWGLTKAVQSGLTDYE